MIIVETTTSLEGALGPAIVDGSDADVIHARRRRRREAGDVTHAQAREVGQARRAPRFDHIASSARSRRAARLHDRFTSPLEPFDASCVERPAFPAREPRHRRMHPIRRVVQRADPHVVGAERNVARNVVDVPHVEAADIARTGDVPASTT